MAEAIDTAFVVVKPDTRGFGAETRRQVSQQLRTQPVAAPPIKPRRGADRDLVPRVGVRGPAIRGLLAFGTTLTGVTGGVIAAGLAFRTAFNEVKEGQAVMAQTNAVLKSTNNVASVSAKGVQTYAGELSKLSGIDDEVVQAGENIILTFKNVRNVGGEGNAVFDRTVKAAVDLAKFGGGAFGDMNSASKQLGKALNDPIKGMTALSRSGITFSQAQKDTIKNLVETGRTLDAQKLILKEVESQVGGSAKAYGETLPGALDRTRNSISNLLGSGLERIAPNLAEGADAVADFFEGLERGGGAGAGLRKDLAGIGQAVKSSIVPLFNAVKQEGPRFRSIFKSISEIVRNSIPVLKFLGVVVGVTLVLAFKIAIRVFDLFLKNIVRTQNIVKKVVGGIISALDVFLGGLSTLAGAASHLPLVGDKFAGVEDAINAGREALRDFNDELDAANGKQVRVDVTVVTSERTAGGTASPGGGRATAPDATGGAAGPLSGSKALPGPRQREETRLLNQLALDQAEEDVAGQKAVLRQLIGFYNETVRLLKARGVGTRVAQAKAAQAQSELNNLNQQAADDAKAAADAARQSHNDQIAALDQERRDLLTFKIQIAAGTKRIIRDDKAAWAAFIAYLKERVRLAKAAGVGIAAARAELRQARLDAAQVVKDFIQAKFEEQEAFLQGQVDLFDVTGQEGKLATAYKKLIAFYKRMVRREGLTRLERQKYRIALAQTRKDLNELQDETSDTGKSGATFGQLAVDFLKNLHGFSSNLASNVLPRGTFSGLTEATVSAVAGAQTAVKSSMSVAEQVRLSRAGRLPEEHGRGQALAPIGKDAATAALEHREQAQGPATAAQFERLLSQNAAILRVLRRIAQDQDHPEAKFNRKQSPAAVVVGVS